MSPKRRALKKLLPGKKRGTLKKGGISGDLMINEKNEAIKDNEML